MTIVTTLPKTENQCHNIIPLLLHTGAVLPSASTAYVVYDVVAQYNGVSSFVNVCQLEA